MARSAKIYDFTLTAGGAFVLPVEGSYYRIISSTGAVEVKRDGGSGVGPIYAGQGERDEEFKRLTLIDKSGAANTGYIVVSDGTFVDDRITGEVSVIDGGLARTITNSAFIGYGIVTPATTTNNGGLQIWNNAAIGGKNIVVEQMSFYSNVANTGVNMNLQNTALTTLFNPARSKLGNGADSTIAQVRSQEGTAWSATILGVLFVDTANKTMPFIPKEPIVIPPQWGLVIRDGLVTAHTLGIMFEHFEI